MTNLEWLKGQCDRYVNGQCHTASCMKRGGYDPQKPETYDSAATCHAHEIVKQLERPPEEIKMAGRCGFKSYLDLEAELIALKGEPPIDDPGPRPAPMKRPDIGHKCGGCDCIINADGCGCNPHDA